METHACHSPVTCGIGSRERPTPPIRIPSRRQGAQYAQQDGGEALAAQGKVLKARGIPSGAVQ